MTKQLQDAYIVAASRTPIGKAPRGMFKNTRPDELLVHAIKSAVAQVPGLDTKVIEDAIIGCAIPEAEQGLNVARMGALLAGLPNTVGGVTVNRFCASGLTALAMAADRIRVGESDAMIAGGCESMSMVPMMGNKPSMSPHIFDRSEDFGIAYGMGLTAEKVAERWKISREAQDQFSVESHRRAIAAQQAGEFNDEIAAYTITERFPDLATGEVKVKTREVALDEGPRADTSMEGLARLRTVFANRGSVTAGNSSQTSDGAGALIVVSEKVLKEFNLTPLARFYRHFAAGEIGETLGDRVGGDFVVELAGLLRGDGAAVRFDRELVLRFAADLPALGDLLGGQAHAVGDAEVFTAIEDVRRHRRLVAHHRHHAHRLAAACDHRVGFADADAVGGHRQRGQT